MLQVRCPHRKVAAVHGLVYAYQPVIVAFYHVIAHQAPIEQAKQLVVLNSFEHAQQAVKDVTGHSQAHQSIAA